MPKNRSQTNPWNKEDGTLYMRGSREGRGQRGRTPLKNLKNIEFLSNKVLKIIKLLSQPSMLIVVFESSPLIKTTNKKKSDKTFWIRACNRTQTKRHPIQNEYNKEINQLPIFSAGQNTTLHAHTYTGRNKERRTSSNIIIALKWALAIAIGVGLLALMCSRY